MKIGVIGVGHLGKIHLKCIRQIPEYHLAGIFDVDLQEARKVSDDFGVSAFETLEELTASAEVFCVVTPTTTHYAIAEQLIRAGKHVFIEKPVTRTTAEAKKLQALAEKYDVKVQVGHVERFNPALRALEDKIVNPGFLEVHRLANYNPRSTDVSVIHDLMIHDIDILLHFIKSPVKEVRANGLSILSRKDDICSARIEFENGAVANLTASRISVKNMRKMRLFQPDAYISIDFLEKNAQIISIDEEKKDENAMRLELEDHEKYISIENIEGPQGNAIREELEAFYKSIKENSPVLVPLVDGIRALALVEQIEEAIGSQRDVEEFLHMKSDKV